MRILVMALGATVASVLPLSLQAQDQQGGTQVQTQQMTQSQCVETLNSLAQRMNDDGYWLAGYSGYGVNTVRGAPATGTMGGTAPGMTTAPAVDPAPPAATADPAAPAPNANPWVDVTWAERPHYEIGTLFRAAQFLANSGNEEGCMTVANAAEQRYDGYIGQLRELGVEPQEITDWRHAEIAAAVPVSETSFPRRIDDLIGADVRNAQDEDLGDIQDVVLDPQSGAVQYVIVSRGGFFGIGSEEVAVPWEHLRVAPGMSTFVLPVDDAAMDQAPRVAQGALVDPSQTGSVRQEEVDTYWRDTLGQSQSIQTNQ